MDREHRVSAGAIVIENGRLLMVRYTGSDGSTYLVGPGGGALSDESIYQAVVREVREETGLEVEPVKILFVEDMLSLHHRITKIWLLCDLKGGVLASTQGALEEGIVGVAWYRKPELHNETVYPSGIVSCEWDALHRPGWEARYLGLSVTDF
jgi:8-oxo-dGTP diphosphatase